MTLYWLYDMKLFCVNLKFSVLILSHMGIIIACLVVERQKAIRCLTISYFGVCIGRPLSLLSPVNKKILSDNGNFHDKNSFKSYLFMSTFLSIGESV